MAPSWSLIKCEVTEFKTDPQVSSVVSPAWQLAKASCPICSCHPPPSVLLLSSREAASYSVELVNPTLRGRRGSIGNIYRINRVKFLTDSSEIWEQVSHFKHSDSVFLPFFMKCAFDFAEIKKTISKVLGCCVFCTSCCLYNKHGSPSNLIDFICYVVCKHEGRNGKTQSNSVIIRIIWLDLLVYVKHSND